MKWDMINGHRIRRNRRSPVRSLRSPVRIHHILRSLRNRRSLRKDPSNQPRESGHLVRQQGQRKQQPPTGTEESAQTEFRFQQSNLIFEVRETYQILEHFELVV